MAHKHTWRDETITVRGLLVTASWECGSRNCRAMIVRSHRFRRPSKTLRIREGHSFKGYEQPDWPEAPDNG